MGEQLAGPSESPGSEVSPTLHDAIMRRSQEASRTTAGRGPIFARPRIVRLTVASLAAAVILITGVSLWIAFSKQPPKKNGTSLVAEKPKTQAAPQVGSDRAIALLIRTDITGQFRRKLVEPVRKTVQEEWGETRRFGKEVAHSLLAILPLNQRETRDIDKPDQD